MELTPYKKTIFFFFIPYTVVKLVPYKLLNRKNSGDQHCECPWPKGRAT